MTRDALIDEIAIETFRKQKHHMMRRIPLPEVIEAGNPLCRHIEHIDNTGLGKCTLCGRIRKYAYIDWDGLIDANEKNGQEKGHIASAKVTQGRQKVKRHYGGATV